MSNVGRHAISCEKALSAVTYDGGPEGSELCGPSGLFTSAFLVVVAKWLEDLDIDSPELRTIYFLNDPDWSRYTRLCCLYLLALC